MIRHGESTSDVEDRFGGDYDDHLTEKGVRQSRELAERLAGLKGSNPLEVVFTSPRFRAWETARIVAARLKVELKVVENLRERNRYGVLTGLTKSEAAEKYPELLKLLPDTLATLPGGEAYEAFKARIIEALDAVLKTNYRTLAVVTHGGPIRLIFREILKLGELKTLHDCAFFELKTDSEGLTLLGLDPITLGLDGS